VTQPVDTVTKYFRVILASTGAAVPSLTDADFTFLGVMKQPGVAASTYTTNDEIEEVSAGVYAWTYDKPSVKCNDGQLILPVSATHLIEFISVQGELENQDLDSLAALSAAPLGGAVTSFAFGALIPMDRSVYRKRTVVQAFTGLDLSTAAYDNWQVGISDDTQTELRWDCGSGKIDGFTITGDASGNLTIVWPESLIGPVYTTWTTSRAYARGDFVVPTVNNGFCYQLTSAAGTSHAATEPAWPTTVGGTVTDNGMTWTCRLRSIWVASVARAVGDMIRPTTPNGFIYRCIVAGTSHAATEPTWANISTVHGTITDGTVTWQRQDNPDAYLGTGDDTEAVRYETTADELSTAATVPVIPSSTLNLKRREFGV
jgi:hypothetical protein